VTGAAPLVIRQALAQDLEAVQALAQAVARQPLLQRYGTTPAGLIADLTRVLQAQTSEPTELLLLADCAQRGLLGFARVLLRGQLGRGGYLKLIALLPGLEGQGIGDKLLRGVEEQVAAHSPDLFLLTSDFNQGAQRFYGRAGYVQVGALPDFARPGIVELLYWKRLR